MYIIKKTDNFDKWLRKLKDLEATARILTKLKKIELGNLGDYKSLGNKISEIRLSYGPGYRLYFTRSKDVIIILLVGGTKSSK